MGITLTQSRQAGGKNPAREALIEQIVEDYKNAPYAARARQIVLVPKQDTRQVERQLIENIGEGGLFGLEVLSPERLRERIMAEQRPMPVVDAHGRLMLLQKSLVDVAPELSVYQGSAGRQGFAEQAAETISAFKQAEIAPQALSEPAQKFEGTLLADKLRDITKIYARFAEVLGDERCDEDDFMRLAALSAPDASFLQGATIYAMDFGSLDKPTIALLVQMAKVADVRLAVTTDPALHAEDMAAFLCVNTSVAALDAAARDAGVDVLRRYLPQSAPGPLGHLSRGLFSYKPAPYGEAGTFVGLYAGRDPWDEVVLTAQLILKQVEDGAAYSDIALAPTDSALYEPMIRRVFAEYDIPVFIDETYNVIDNHFIQALLAALDAAASGFARADVLGYIKSDFSGLTPGEADRLENYVIEAGVRPYEWRRPFKRVPPAWRAEHLRKLPEDHEINRLREKIYARLSLLPKKNAHLTYREFCEALIAFLEKTGAQEALDDLSQTLAAQGEQETASRYRQIWNILIEETDQMKTALGDMTADYAAFIAALKTGLSSYTVGVIPEDEDAVIIANLNRSRLPAIKTLYVLGMNEGLLPAARAEEGLFSERDREQIEGVLNLDGAGLNTRRFCHERELYALYNAVTAASENVVFTYALYDSAAEKLKPSRYIDVVRLLFKEVDRDRPKVFRLLHPHTAMPLLLGLPEDDAAVRLAQRAYGDWLTENGEEAGHYGSWRLGQDFAAVEDTLKTVNAADLYAKKDGKIQVSVSKLEKFAACPFGYFVKYGLRPSEREEYEVRALDTGTLVHAFFSEFFTAVKEAAADEADYRARLTALAGDREAMLQTGEALFEKIFSQSPSAPRYTQTASSRFLVTKMRRIVLTALAVLLAQLEDSAFLPQALEYSFEDTPTNGVVVTGQIDRIDLGADTNGETPVRVIDYKTGNKKLDYTDLYYGHALQLAVYLNAAVQAVGTDAFPAGAFYFYADSKDLERPDDIRGQLLKKYQISGVYDAATLSEQNREALSNASIGKLDQQELKTLLDYSHHLVRTLSLRLIEGDTEIKPAMLDGTNKSCTYCPYKDICLYTEKNTACKTQTLEKIDKQDFFERAEQALTEEESEEKDNGTTEETEEAT